MKVALVHYWLTGMRGGEHVLEQLVNLFPQADLFTHVADPDKLSPRLKSRPIHETFIARLPGARRHYQKYLAFMPRALEELDLSGYDLIISSESGPAKGIIAPPGTPHICYAHSPMRYIWDQYGAYSKRLSRIEKMYFSHLAHRLRIWDVSTAARVDKFVANSNFVAQRIRRYYHRDAQVVHPPVDLDAYHLPDETNKRSHYLFVSELVPYKKADLVIEAFRDLDRQLVVVGDGSQRSELEQNLPPNVRLLGRVPSADLPGLYQTAKALIFPAEEDFGIVPVEAMACGTPVLAYGQGGVRDSVIEGRTGLFFDDQSSSSIVETIHRFERAHFNSGDISEHASGFGAERFRREFSNVVDAVLSDWAV
ncbi:MULTISPECIES: glycosyltransferase [Ruegeria]|uniref:glycosyltransferase n=1 Tax=Ruegeria TaxID=97050 RepID=UPI000DE90A08|nr:MULTISPECIES: glycosyltransferase [Ruegeria]RBW52512.1 glycosyltransferase family 4 protein [Ruegeria sp. A3M17]